MSKIFITGFNGYLGSAICEKFNNEKIVKIGNKKKIYNREENILLEFPKKINKEDICIHLASISGNESEINKKATYETNVIWTQRICDLGFKKIIFLSTSAVYGYSDKYFLESDKLNPTNYYIETKILGEEIVKKNKDNLILRSAILMGPSPNTNWNLLINLLVKEKKKFKKSLIIDPISYRPYLDVNDAANAILDFTNRFASLSGIFNFGFSDMNYNKFQILELLKEIYGPVDYEVVENDKNIYPVGVRNYKINCDGIKKFIKNKTSIRKTLINLGEIL